MRPLLTTLLIAATAGLIAAQQQPPPPRSGVTFRVDVNFVELDAIVTDAQGNFVRDLTRDDFELLEEGQPQTISAFTLVDLPTRRPDPPLVRATPIEPDVQTNLEEFNGRVIVLLLDDLMTDARRSHHVRAAASQFVRRYVGANDLVAVVHSGSAAKLGQDFTSSQARLLAAIGRFQGQKLPSASLMKLDDYWKKWRSRNEAAPVDTLEAERAQKARSSLSTLESLADFLGNIRGRRKALVWFSEGLDYDIERVFDVNHSTVVREDMRATIDTATRAGVSFYGVDVRGVGAGLDTIADIPAMPALPDDPNKLDVGPGPLFDEVRRAQDFLRTMSAETGGFAIVNESDLDTAFARIIQDNSSYYLLGYYPTNDKRDGKYRRFSVRVKRPGLRVRSRDGYTAPKGKPSSTPTIAKDTAASPAVRAALDSPIPMSDLGLRVFAAPFLGPSNRSSVAVVVELGPKGLAFAQRDGGHFEEIEVVILPVDASGKALPGTRDVSPMGLSQRSFELVSAKGFAMTRRLDLPPGRYQLHVAARAGNSRAVGAVLYDLDVPDFSKLPLSISGLTLTSREAAQVPTPQPEKAFLEVVPDVPTAWREFGTSDTLTLFSEVYDTRGSTPHRVSIATTVTADDGRVAFSAADERTSDELGTRSGGFGHQAKIPLRGFAPGRYVLRVEARIMLADGAVAAREIEFAVR